MNDRRRTARLVKFAEQVAQKPDASTPTQAEEWSDTQGAYRVIGNKPVSIEAITAPHRALTRSYMTEGLWLILNDTTEWNSGDLRDMEGIGRVGSETDRGFFLHTAMARNALTGQVAGVSVQELDKRPLKKVPRVTSAQRKKISSRETDVWGRVIDRVGPPPEGVTYRPVCDRGADNFDVYCHLITQRSGGVSRAGEFVTLTLAGMSHTKAQRHKVKSIDHRMERIDPLFVPWCLGVRILFQWHFAVV